MAPRSRWKRNRRLRSVVMAIGAICLAIGAVALFTHGASPGAVFLFWGVALVGGILFERFRYKRLEKRAPGAGWSRTTERFVDEDTGKIVTVYIRPETGERTYVQE